MKTRRAASPRHLFLVSTLALAAACASAKLPYETVSCQYTEGVQRMPAATTVRLALVGDVGADAEFSGPPVRMERLRAALASVGSLDGVVLLGDNFYPCGLETADDWKIMEPLARLGVPLFPVLGNHDHGCSPAHDRCAQVEPGPPGATLRERWRFPALNYGVSWRGIGTIAFVDTQPIARGHVPPGEAGRFIASVFETAPAPWRIVAGHHVFYSSGPHGSIAERRALARLRKILPSAEGRGATLFVSGHDHHLELIRRGKSTFVISGSGSKTRRLAAGRAPGSLFRAVTHGFVLLELTEDRAVLSTMDLDGRAIYGPVVVQR